LDFLTQTVAIFDRLIAAAQSATATVARLGDRRYSRPTRDLRGPMEDCVLIACATGSREEAARIGRTLVAERLAACAQMFAIDSIYRWDGKVQEDAEWLLHVKTSAAAAQAATDRILALHSYAVPEVTVMPIIGGSPAYLEWVAVSVGDQNG
jgi:periplasmic divalent cation tolerance protein